MSFFRNRRWIARSFFIFYGIYVICMLPFSVVVLDKKGYARHIEAWFIGGFLVMAATGISFWGILQHWINYTKPDCQRNIIRILLMVPIYGTTAWLALRFQNAAIYLDTVRECYKAYVIYIFMEYLLNYLHSQYPNLEETLRNRERVNCMHKCIHKCFFGCIIRSSFIECCRLGILQFTIIKTVTTLIALVCELTGTYHEGNFDFKSAWSYLTIIDSISQIYAIYYMSFFREAYKEELGPIRPTLQYWCIYFVIFLSFWQSVLISILAKLNVIPHGGTWGFNYSIEQVATGLQDFLILIEMFVASILHTFAFPHDPYISITNANVSCCTLIKVMWNLSDTIEDSQIIGEKAKRQDNEQTHLKLAVVNSQSTCREYTGVMELQSANDRSRVIETTPSINNYVVLEDEESDQVVERTSAHILRRTQDGV